MITLILTVRNVTGVLRRVTGVIDRKYINIAEIHSKVDNTGERSSITITLEYEDDKVEISNYLIKQLSKLYDVYSAVLSE